MSVRTVITLALTALFLENFVFTRFLGVRAVFDASRSLRLVFMNGAVMIVLVGVAAPLVRLLDEYLLMPRGLEYLRLLVSVGVLMILSMGGEELMRRRLPGFYDALHAAQPMMMTNTAILGAVLLANQEDLSAPQAALFGIFGALGFLLAALLFIGVRERIDMADCPGSFRGFPIALITLGLLSMAFMGFTGLRLW